MSFKFTQTIYLFLGGSIIMLQKVAAKVNFVAAISADNLCVL